MLDDAIFRYVTGFPFSEQCYSTMRIDSWYRVAARCSPSLLGAQLLH